MQTTLTPEEKREMAKKFAGMVKHIASRVAATLPAHLEVRDLVQDGAVGLLEALNRFDPTQGIKFHTFASSRIRGAILDALRSADWASRGSRRRWRELVVAEEQLTHALGRQPDSAALSDFTGFPVAELHRRRQDNSRGYVMPLEYTRENGVTAEEPVDPKANIELESMQSYQREALQAALKTLPERSQTILSLYYFEEMNLREIGAVMGVSEARISQIHRRCLQILRESMHELELVS